MRVIIGFVLLLLSPIAAAGQEDIEPRTIGATGVNTIGLGGFIDGFSSPEESLPVHASVHADVTRFLTDHLAVRGGVIGSTTFRDAGDEITTGPGAASLHGLISGLYYFTPQSMLSLYSGIEYRAQLMRRADKDAGSALGVIGVQATVSSRAALFVEGGYGARLTRGADGELQTRIAGQVGLRIKF
jgi:hypothetical protein